MKEKNSIYVTVGALNCILVMLTFGFGWAQIVKPNKHAWQSVLGLKISVQRQNFKQGEIVPIEIEITNTSSSRVSLRGATVQSGNVQILISNSDMKFREYRAGGPQTKSGDIVLLGNSTAKSDATILWNLVQETESLSTSAVKRIKDRQLMTSYAFQEADVYYVKAVLTVPGEQLRKVESPPVQLVIDRPTGNDLIIWNQIKINGDFAYFIQEGDVRIPSYKPDERAKFLTQVEEIIAQYPESFYSTSLRQSLDKFRAEETKRQECLQKMLKQKPQ